MKQKSASERIMDTLEQLLYKKDLTKISVNEIIKEAGVSKTTFYRCFQDKYDLACKLYDRMFAPIDEEYSRTKNYKKKFMDGVHLIYNNKQFFKALFVDPYCQNSVYLHNIQSSYNFWLSHISEEKLTDEMRLELYVFAHGQIAVAWEIVLGQLPMDFEKSMEHMIEMTPPYLKVLLQI